MPSAFRASFSRSPHSAPRGCLYSSRCGIADWRVRFSTYCTSAGPRLAAVVFDSSDGLRDREEFSLQHLLAGSRILVSAVCHEIRNLGGAIAAVHAQLARTNGLTSNEDFRTLGS